MLNLLLALILILIIVFIVIQTVTVRITYTREAIINIDFTLFSLILYPSRKKEKINAKREHSYKNKITNNFIKAAAIKKGLEYLFRRAQITVHDINIPTQSNDPAKFAVRSQNISSVILIILTYLSIKTDAIISEDNSFVYLKNSELEERPLIDLTVISTFFNTMLAFLITFFEIKKRKRRRVQKIVGNQNE